MIPPRSRLLIGLAAGLLALVVIGAILQAVRSLLWDLSYLLPGWLLTPVLLLAVGLILALGIQIGWPWWQSFSPSGVRLRVQYSPCASRSMHARHSCARRFHILITAPS